MFQCIVVLYALDTELGIRCDRVALFSDFNHLFELLDQVLLPIAVVIVPFIYWN